MPASARSPFLTPSVCCKIWWPYRKMSAKQCSLAGCLLTTWLLALKIYPQTEQGTACPDYCFYLAETLLVIDHQKKYTRIQASLFTPSASEKNRLAQRIAQLQQQMSEAPPALPVQRVEKMTCEVSQTDDQYGAVVRQMQKAIRAGEIFQVVPSRRFSLPCPSPLAAYDVLKKSNPSPYMFFMQDNDFTLFGASPESSLKYDATSRQIEIYPIAGTRPRGRRADGSLDRDLDSRIELEMRTDHKELSEHLMLVDLARNDLARICTPGSRYVADLTKVDRYSFVMHLVSRVVGELRHDLDVLHAYRACMNMGTLSGAPKVRAMQLIADAGRTPSRQLRWCRGLFHRSRRPRYLHRDPLRLR